jgi:hypothetical protein
MTCNEVENWMLTDETPNRPSAEVRRHLRSCAGCRRGYGRLVRLIHEVHTAPLPPLPPVVKERILTQLEPRTPAAPAIVPIAVAQAQPVALPMPHRRWRWQRWHGWAAAALLCLALGFGLARLARKGPEQPEPEVPGPDAGYLAVEDRLLERHLELAEAREPTRRLHVLSDMAADVRKESMEQARRGAAEDLKVLVWLHARILHEGILRVARALPRNAQSVTAVINKLHRAGESAEKQARTLPDAVAEPMRQLGQQAQEMSDALADGSDPGPPPAAVGPARLDVRSLLSVLVATSLQMAHEEDPVKLAEHSTEVADTLTQQLIKKAGKVEDETVTRLAGQLEEVMERAVQGNLDRIDPEQIDPARQKQMEKVQEKAGAALAPMEPNLRQLPKQAQVNVRRALELAKQVQMKKDKKPVKGPKKDKDKPGKPR